MTEIPTYFDVHVEEWRRAMGIGARWMNGRVNAEKHEPTRTLCPHSDRPSAPKTAGPRLACPLGVPAFPLPTPTDRAQP